MIACVGTGSDNCSVAPQVVSISNTASYRRGGTERSEEVVVYCHVTYCLYTSLMACPREDGITATTQSSTAGYSPLAPLPMSPRHCAMLMSCRVVRVAPLPTLRNLRQSPVRTDTALWDMLMTRTP